jgi:hypothetical protein
LEYGRRRERGREDYGRRRRREAKLNQWYIFLLPLLLHFLLFILLAYAPKLQSVRIFQDEIFSQ